MLSVCVNEADLLKMIKWVCIALAEIATTNDGGDCWP